jgi:hypothetical protein
MSLFRGIEQALEETLQIEPLPRGASNAAVVEVEPVDVNDGPRRLRQDLCPQKAGAPEGAPRPAAETTGVVVFKSTQARNGGHLSKRYIGTLITARPVLPPEALKISAAASLCPASLCTHAE